MQYITSNLHVAFMSVLSVCYKHKKWSPPIITSTRVSLRAMLYFWLAISLHRYRSF